MGCAEGRSPFATLGLHHMPVDPQTLEQIALSEDEYRLIVRRLGREPNAVELGMFGSLWSEHCGYKHSRPLLKFFPSHAPWVLLPPGQENAGAVDIGDGLAVVFKMESHNHPSAVEPFHGAATGVGGIVRDILAMGARPIALLNSLRFGPLSDPANRYLFNGVISGISWYGNCIGVPDVGGEILFSHSYSHNPLVNAMCVGLVPTDKLVKASAGAPGNLLLLVGSPTGRDGIHGASGLASRTFESDEELKPTVQVADPFTGKLLIEACLEAAATGTLDGMQDLGAAGLTSSTVESAYRAGAGFDIDVDHVHQRESGMGPYEVMLSESQERMLLMAHPRHLDTLVEVFRKWELPYNVIGSVTSGTRARVYQGSNDVADVPVSALINSPTYRMKGARPDTDTLARQNGLSSLPHSPHSPNQVLLSLLRSPNIASKRAIYQQYDHQVQTNTVIGPGADASVIRIKGTRKAIAVCTDGNGRYCYLDPYQGGAIAVAEACRNLSCVGARPLAITNCLNFGNPQRPEIYYQLEWCIRGMARACRILGIPVVSGNVSLYNETQGTAIYPTPIVGAMGLLDDARQHATSQFKFPGDLVVLVGAARVRSRSADLAGSEYLEVILGQVLGRPSIDLNLEAKVHHLCREAIREGVVRSAHDCSDGGLAVALAECCIPSALGFTSTSRVRGRWEAALFGEAQSRVIVSLPPGSMNSLQQLASQDNVPLALLGTVGGDMFVFQGLVDLPISQLDQAWSNGLEEALS